MMDSSFGRELGGAIVAMMILAIVGAVLGTIALVGGGGWLIWYLWHHLAWVS
jgi:hypothetical protein